LIELRRRRNALLFGRYGAVLANDDVLVFTRELAGERILIALNLGAEPTTARAASGEWTGQLLLSSAGDRESERVRGPIKLRARFGDSLCGSSGHFSSISRGGRRRHPRSPQSQAKNLCRRSKSS
jgi:hypothetical protein